MVSNPQIGLIIPVRDRKHYTAAILTQLNQQIAIEEDKLNCALAINIIVVDDNSSDGTPGLIEESFPQVHLLHGDGNLWWTGAIAKGMAFAVQQLRVQYLVWLNDDIVLGSDFIAQLIAQCERTQGSKLITGGIIREQLHPDWVVFSGVISGQPITSLEPFQSSPLLAVDTLNGNLVMMPATVVSDLGLPDANRFRHYGGDYEYICRAKLAGYKIQLSSLLQAKTEYGLADLIRYMPLWMQWHFSSTWSQKWQVLRSLTNRKSPYNVEHMVNSIHRNQSSVPSWKYGWFYVKKLIILASSEYMPQSLKQQRIEDYLSRLQVPSDLVQALLQGQLTGDVPPNLVSPNTANK